MAENMIKAGRAGLTFGGDWDETVEYNRLVGVRYDNKLFFSKKPVPIGTIPEDGEYWFLAYEGLTDEQWEALLNGTQQVGDSARLGGKEPSEYFLSSGTVLNTSILEYALTVPYGTHFIRLGGNSHDGTDLPHSNYRYSCASIEKRSSTQLTVVLWGISADYSFKVNHYTDGVWYGWKGLSDYLPLSGGTVTIDSYTGFRIKRNTTDNARVAGIMLGNNNDDFGGFACDGYGNYFAMTKDGSGKTLLHTGNKPSGTYTGNGDATERTINVGGIGNALLVYGGGKGAIVYPDGAIVSNGTTVETLPDTQCKFRNGVYTLSTTHPALNNDGAERSYQVL